MLSAKRARTRRSQSRFSSDDAAYRNIYSTHRWRSCDFHNRSWNIRMCGTLPSGCAAYRNDCSMIRSSCCGWRIRNPNRRSSGNRLHAGADCWNIPPSFHRNSCGRLRRWFRACSDRSHSYIPGSRFACKWHHFHSPEPMYGCRRKGRSMTHSFRRRDPCRRKCQDF